MEDAVGWIVALGFCYIAYKYLFASSSSSTSGGGPGGSARGSTSGSSAGRRRVNHVPQSSIDQVSNVFPNIPARNIRFALENSRGNVQAVVERALRDGYLPEPPASFFPTDAASSSPQPGTSRSGTPANAGSSQSSASSPPIGNAKPASLIERLGLRDRLATDGDGDDAKHDASVDRKGKGKAVDVDEARGSSTSGMRGSTGGTRSASWAATSEAREQSLRERKAKMVLEARRKMLEKERSKQSAAAPVAPKAQDATGSSSGVLASASSSLSAASS